MNKRLETLDYLRGVMAFSVMIYHYYMWASGTHLDSSTLLGKLGVYAVSIFFILSGVSLGIVYKTRIKTIKDISPYIKKRFFRIAPLLWFVTILTILLIYIGSYFGIESRDISLKSVILNFTLLFGFIDNSTYIASGAWSIGNELVFYAILPFVLIIENKYRYSLPIITFISFLVYIYFAFFVFDYAGTFEEYWKLYINPFNQLFLFLSGVVIGYYFDALQNKSIFRNWHLVYIICFLIAAFYFYPVSGNRIALITGIDRLIFTVICILIVYILAAHNDYFKAKKLKFLGYLGLVSYSIYLIHPLIYYPVSFIGKHLHISSIAIIIISVLTTLLISRYVYRYVEYPLMNMGKK